MSDITIPPEVVEAAARVLHANAEVFHDVLWDDLGDYDREAYREEARAAILAALKAWPGSAVCHYTIDDEGYEMVLPIPFPQGPENE